MAKKSTPAPAPVNASKSTPVANAKPAQAAPPKITPQVPAIPGTAPMGLKPASVAAPAPVVVPEPVTPAPAPEQATTPAVPATKRGGRRAPATVVATPFIPAAIKAAVDHAANTRLADLLFYFGLTSDPINIQSCVITSELMNKLLTGNIANRSLSKPNVKRLNERMCNGFWDWRMPVVVIIDTLGRMHNSQHTGTALIEAEKTRCSSQEWIDHFASLGMNGPLCFQNGVVISGIDPETANHIDRVMVRKHSDIVFRKHLLADTNRSQAALRSLSNVIATTCKFTWLRLVWGQKQRVPRYFGHEELVAFLEQYPGIVKSAEYVFDQDGTSGKDGAVPLHKRCSMPQAATLHFLMSNVAYYPGKEELDEADDQAMLVADEFFKQLAMGGAKGGTDPVSVYCEWIASMGKANNGNKELEARFDGLIVAASAFMAGDTISRENLIVPEDVQQLTTDNYPMWTTSTGTTGYTDGEGVFHWLDDQQAEQVWTKADMKKAKISLLPITVPSYPCLGGLDVPPSDEDWTDETVEEGDVQKDGSETTDDPSEVQA